MRLQKVQLVRERLLSARAATTPIAPSVLLEVVREAACEEPLRPNGVRIVHILRPALSAEAAASGATRRASATEGAREAIVPSLAAGQVRSVHAL